MPAISLTQRTPAGTAADAWAPGPIRPRLGDGAVHVWLADLTRISDDLSDVLSPDEHARAERFLDARRGMVWARAHGLLRVLLGRYLDADPRRLRFVAGPHGKPALLGGALGSRTAASSSRLSFNLSHSGHLAVYAFSKARAVGVDVEVAGRALNVGAIAVRAFGPAEARRLGELDPAARKGEFLRAWTQQEAKLKCRGTGIGGRAVDYGERKLWTSELEMGVRGRAAVAVERQPHELRCWDWRELTGRPGGRRPADGAVAF